MLSYNLAKKLREAGFPNVKLPVCSEGHEEDGKHEMFGTCVDTPGEYPTLSELIEVCGDRFSCLWKVESEWIAKWFMNMEKAIEFGSGENIRILKGEGNSPEEAVAQLYLKLHEVENK